MKKKRCVSNSGATIVEYAIGLVLLIAVLLFAVQALQEAAKERADESTKTVEGMVPCVSASGQLGGDQCL